MALISPQAREPPNAVGAAQEKRKKKKKEKDKKKKKKHEANVNECSTIKNLWDVTKAVLTGKSIAIQAFLKKEEKSQNDNLTYLLNE